MDNEGKMEIIYSKVNILAQVDPDIGTGVEQASCL
jgi:hypothetical protein